MVLVIHLMVQLLLRFYDPTSGILLLDGYDVRDLNVTFYRSKIGYVGQVRRGTGRRECCAWAYR